MEKFAKRCFALVLSAALVLLTVPTSWTAGETIASAESISASGNCGDNLTWVLDETGVLTISGTGEMDNWGSTEEIPWYDNRTDVTAIVIEEGVTNISNVAFSGGFSNLASVSIPNTVTSIGLSAFQACSALTEIIIPASVTSIGSSAFYNCSALNRITFEGKAPSLNSLTLDGINALESIMFKGDAPSSFSSSCFGGIKATVYYPQDNPTWTEDRMQDYGGTITWIAYDPAEPTEISIQAETTQMTVFDSQKLSVDWSGAYIRPIQWSSSDDTVISVTTDSGCITAWKAGTATISCTTYNGLTASLTITVEDSGNSAITSEVTEVLGGTATDNITDNNYTIWGNTVKSYLMENQDGTLTRVEYVSGTGVLVETYSAAGSPDSTLILEAELSIFGGFYAGEEYNFLVFGQNNPEEDGNVEVMRIVKYSKSWNRLDSCSIYGANTCIPFDAGSLRMTETDGRLYIHTCHEMYASGDGQNHQANMTFVLDIAAMEITVSGEDSSNLGALYVSHSFNQFIQTDGENVYYADHGDGFPRGVALTRVMVDDSITWSRYNQTVTLNVQGKLGANATGVSIGGLELSTDNCLIVGNSVDQSDPDTYDAYGQRNIFLTVTDKNLIHTEIQWLTDYTEEDGIMPRTPQMVKLSDNRFLILWEEYQTDTKEATTQLVLVDGSGTLLSDVVSTHLRLSDCQPIYTSAGKVTWYVTNGAMDLYTIDPYNLSSLSGETIRGACGPNLSYLLQDGVLTISGTGAMADWDYASDVGIWYTPWYPYRDQITSAVIQEDVTSIGVNTFYDCFNLSRVTIPANVTRIGANAFSGAGLEAVYYQGTLEEWFAISMESDPISSSCKLYLDGYNGIIKWGDLGDELHYILTEQGVLSIWGNGVLEQTMFYDGSWSPYYNLVTSLEIGEGVTEIGTSCFTDFTQLTQISLSESVAAIGNNAFQGCLQLANVSLANGLTSIGDFAFSDCWSLTSITLPDSVTSIGSYGFYACTSLASVTIPIRVTSIGNYAFDSCSDDLVLYGFLDSYAQSYAGKNNLSFVALDSSPYDLNSDGVVDVLDVMALVQQVVGIHNGITAVDLTGDSIVDVQDAMYLAQIIAQTSMNETKYAACQN